MINDFVNKYQLSKTLRFSLIPYGKTEENFSIRHLLEEDEERAKQYIKVKSFMDEYYKYNIESVLNKTILNDVDKYSELYFKQNKSDKEENEIEKLEDSLRKQISKAFESYTVNGTKIYSLLFKKEFIAQVLPEFLTNGEDLEIVEQFNKFSTYFQGFWQNRKNIYTAERKSTGVPYRCINDNLPKFLDNVKSSEKIFAALPQSDIDELNSDFKYIYNFNIRNIFNVDYFSFVLSQSGIEKYNNIIGGYSNSDNTKIEGVNEKVNRYNQQVAKSDKSKKLPLLKPLFKQILSDKDSISFIPEKFEKDSEVLDAIYKFYVDNEIGISNALKQLNDLICNIEKYDTKNIYITSGAAVSNISNRVFGSWSTIRENWNAQYESNHKIGKNAEKFYDKENSEYKKIKSFSVFELQELGNSDESITKYLAMESQKLYDSVKFAYSSAENLLSSEYINNKSLSKNDNAVELIKGFLDSVKNYEYFLKPFCGTGKEEKDNLFYGEFSEKFEQLKSVDLLYNKVRNYMTQKPYSNDKIKLNFQNPQFLGGWDKNKETDYRSVLLRKNGLYYLGIMDKQNNKAFENFPEDENSDFEKTDYKLIPDPSKMLPKVFFADKNKELYSPTDEILRIRESGSFKKGSNFNLDDCHTFIDFYKDCIEKHPDWKNFNFKFSDTKNYADISQFFKEISDQAYSIGFRKISKTYLDELVENGSLYLFQIYNKDFSPCSKGTPNLHTLYFKMLFDEQNLSDVVYKLSGGAEMFYRKKSINKEEQIVHPKNQPLKNKNPDNKKTQSCFEYDIIKDKRYTKRQFELHLPITINYKADSSTFINNEIRYALKQNSKNYVIGIDRGERNLIYACVIDSDGKLIEQKSFNIIKADNGYKTDYHALLDSRESDMDKARKSWKTIGTIKELKEGYISQVVHEICRLVVKYDAIIAMEDLNRGFMDSRKKVEKQVYQKFEKMLTQKLNYLVDKKAKPTDLGGLLHAYQLTNKSDKLRNSNQDGIIFYIPAWLTSKIDPTTGFVNLLKPKYHSVDSAIKFFEKFDDIRFNEKSNYFEFDLNYDNFPRCNSDFKKQWTICTYSNRIKTFRNPAKNNEWDNEEIDLCDEFKALFENFDIDYTNNLNEQIIKQKDKKFFEPLTRLLSLTLQMRNSITGSVDVDYLISPVKNSNGEFYDSRNHNNNSYLPCDADANGAYNIARKGLWAVNKIKSADDETKANISIKNSEWLEYAQTHNI